MTGFGSGESASDSVRVHVELRSVNGRHLKMSTRMPAALEPRAHELEGRVRSAVSRGNVTLAISVHRLADAAPGRIAEQVVADYARQMRSIGADIGIGADVGIAAPPSWEALLRLPGAIEQAQECALSDDDLTVVNTAVDAAVADLVSMREREGASLVAILESGAADVDRLAQAVRERAPIALTEHRQRLEERVNKLLEDRATLPEEVLAREMALIADRSDVAEEVDRLASHVEQWRAALAGGGPIGRRLDFLAQELGREANTISSKSSDEGITRAALDLKLAVERLKEQAANVE